MIGYIYMIVNENTDKVYIGSTIHFKKRIYVHKNSLRENRHHSILLQRSFNKHGEKAFHFVIVETCMKDCKVREQELLDTLDFNKLYNVSRTATGGDMISNHPNREAIIKASTEVLRTARRPGPKFGSDNGNWKGGVRYTCSCGRVKTQSARVCGICRDRTGKGNPFYGRSHTTKTKEMLRKAHTGRFNGPQSVELYIDEVLYKSLGDASRALGIHVTTIRHRCLSKNEKFKSYYYKENL